MVLQCTTGVNTEDDGNYEEISNEEENKGMFFFVIYIKCLHYAVVWTNDSVNFVSVIWTITLCFCYAYE